MTPDHVVALRDGRSLSYAEYGDAAGFPVVSAHGGLSCRLDVEAAAAAAGRSRVRLIAPDRPGIGRSDPEPGRTMLDWARDVGELLGLLGVEKFAAMGWSLGGQYAAALGYAFPSRVTRLAIIAGVPPLTEPCVFDDLPAVDRLFSRLSARAPRLARQCFRIMRGAAAGAPQLYGRVVARGLGPADDAVLRAAGYRNFARASREALRQPQGMVEEYRAMNRPWGFTPEELRVRVDVWQGSEDRLVPPKWASQLVRRIPFATMHLRPGGHFLAHLYYGEIFDALRGG